MKRTLAQFGSLFYKDLSLQWGARGAMATALLFALAAVTMFAFVYGPFFSPPELPAAARRRELAKLACSVYWTAAAFAGVVAVYRSAESDREAGALRAVRMDADGGVIYAAKACALAVMVGAAQLALGLLSTAFFGVSWLTLGDVARLVGIGVAASAGIGAVGAFMGAMAVSTRGGEGLLSAGMLPMLLPLLMAASKCAAPVWASEPIQEKIWLALLIAYALIMSAVGLLLIDSALED